jgi:two-component system, NtrC family, sensor kinase
MDMTIIARSPVTPIRNNLSAITGGGARPQVGISIPRPQVNADMNTSLLHTELGVTGPTGELDLLRMQALEMLDDGIWITQMDGNLVYRNAAAGAMEPMCWWRAGKTAAMADLVFEGKQLDRLRSRGVDFGDYKISGAESGEQSERSIGLFMQVLRNAMGEGVGMLFHARDVSKELGREEMLQDRHVELEAAYARVKETQTQLLQSEKMASIGQLAAGVAHEINNPIGYVHSNLGTLQTYARGLLSLLEAYDRLAQSLPESFRSALVPIDELKSRVDYSFLQQDLPQLVEESREGIERVKKIVMDLRDFSHAGDVESDDWIATDLHKGLQSTINIVWNELKYKAEVNQSFGDLPLIECMPSQLNQVFLNLLVNAGHAITDKGVITISTRREGDEVFVSVSDTGVGIPEKNLARIFDPFFTTKVVGKGTGLGLALSYGIVQKHNGRIEVQSVPGSGSTFTVVLPIRRAPSGDARANV